MRFLALLLLAGAVAGGCTDGASVVSVGNPTVSQKIIPRSPAADEVAAGEIWRSSVLSPTSFIPPNASFRCLEHCPEDLSVDAATGEVTWTTTAAFAGQTLRMTFAFQAPDTLRQVQLAVTVLPARTTPTPLPTPGISAPDPLALSLLSRTASATQEGFSLTGAGAESALFDFSVAAAGGVPPYTFRCTSHCPTGFTVDGGTGYAQWLPGFSDAGNHAPVIEVQDAAGSVATAKIAFTILNTDRPPLFPAVASQSATEGLPFTLPLVASDPDGEAISYACLSPCPVGLTIAGNPQRVEWTPNFNQSGSTSATIAALAGGATALQTVAISVTNVPRLPAFSLTSPILSSGNYSSGVASQTLSGTCSQRPLVLSLASSTPAITPTFSNRCAADGTWSMSFTASATTSITLRAEDSVDANDATPLSANLLWAPAVPTLTLTTPTTHGRVYSPNHSVALAGSCSTNVAQLEATPAVGFSDSDCADGSWALNAISLSDTRIPVTITARTSAGVAHSLTTTLVPHFVLGQPSSTEVQQNASALARTVSGSWTDGTRLAIADGANNRVLLWDTFPASGSFSPTVVLGQSDFSANSVNAGTLPGAGTFSNPKGVFFAGGRLYVTDYGNHRVLVWNGWPTQNQAPAHVVLGQQTFSVVSANAGGVGPSTLHGPLGLWADATRLVVAEYANNRVLIWDLSQPLSSGRPADIVLGQNDFVSNGANASFDAAGTRQMSIPTGAFSDGTRLWVTDEGNNRVLQWNSFPTTNGQAADLVLGQANFTVRTANTNGRSATTLFNPRGAVWCGGRLFVADLFNNRILGWNGVPTVSGQAADVVLGQANFTDAQAHPRPTTASSLGLANLPSCSGTRLLAADYENGRVMWWDSADTVTSGASAQGLVGRPTFTTGFAGGYYNGAIGMGYGGVKVGNALAVADYSGNRVLLWNTFPVTAYDLPDVVIGQRYLDEKRANEGGPSAQSLQAPVQLGTDGTRLAICDFTNNRVLIYNTLPTTSYATADVILGQPDATTVSLGTTSAKLRNPDGVSLTADHLVVADRNNHRVMVWNLKLGNGDPNPLTTGRPADLVLGQASFGPVSANRAGAIALNTLNLPIGVAEFTYTDSGAVTRTGLAVSDYGNNRVLLWRDFPTANGQAADFVLGQPDGTTGTANVLGYTASTGLSQPNSVASDGTRLLVSDAGNHRVLVWNSIPETNNPAAHLVLGQPNFSASGANSGLYSAAQGFNGTRQVAISSDGTIIVGQTNASQVRIWSKLPTSNGAPSDIQISAFSRLELKQTPSAQNLMPAAAAVVDNKLFVTDTGANRILVWNSRPWAHNAAADSQWGQSDFTGYERNRSANKVLPTSLSLSNPRSVIGMGSRYLFSDSFNSRVLLFNSFPTATTPADGVLGQSDFVSQLPNSGGISASTLNLPKGLATDGIRLAVVDELNSRVLLWNSLTGASGQPADRVLGQASFTENSPNRGASASASTLYFPSEAVIAEGKLIVSDAGNKRVLIWNSWPTSNGQGADVVLGQVDFGGNGNDATVSNAVNLVYPRDLLHAHGRLYLIDRNAYRILYWNGIPSQNGTPADGVIGQSDMEGITRPMAPGPEAFLRPLGLAAWGNLLVVSDVEGFRVTAFAAP